jgi:hypothetical protein
VENFITQGEAVKFYLEPDPTNNQKIAIFTYLNEPISDDNKYYLQYNDDNISIVAVIGSQLPLYIFQFRSA